MQERNKPWQAAGMAGILIVVLCAGLTGCGGEASKNGDVRQGGKNAVSGHAVSETAVEEQGQIQKKGTCCSDTNLYIATRTKKILPDENGVESEYYVTVLMQTRLDGSCKKEIELERGVTTLIGVAGSWLYYTTDAENSEEDGVNYHICRVPVRKGADGYDEVDTTKVEKIVGSESGGAYSATTIYVDETYLIYLREQNYEDILVVVYDLKAGKELDFDEETSVADGVNYIRKLGSMYAVLTDSYLLVMPPGASGWKGVLDGEYTKEYIQAFGENFLFYDCFPTEEDECEYTPGPDYMNKDIIRVCDGTEDRGFITRKELKKAVEDAAGSVEHMSAKEIEMWEIEDLFCDGDRCYIEVEMMGTHDGVFHMGYLMFSKSVGDKEVRFEEELTKCMRENERTWEGRWCITKKKQKKVIREKSVVNPAFCECIVDGSAYFYCHDEENELHLMCYDLHTGRVAEITKQSPEYYKMFYDQEDYRPLGAGVLNEETDFGKEDLQSIVGGWDLLEDVLEEDVWFEEVSIDEKKK